MSDARLRQLLTAHFNESELVTLCFDIEIDYESLSGQGKAAKARELVAYVRRHGQFNHLLTKCQETRPHVDWWSVVAQTGQTATPKRVLVDVSMNNNTQFSSEQSRNPLFFGMEYNKKEIHDYIRNASQPDGEESLCVVYGPYKVGKTALIEEALREPFDIDGKPVTYHILFLPSHSEGWMDDLKANMKEWAKKIYHKPIEDLQGKEAGFLRDAFTSKHENEIARFLRDWIEFESSSRHFVIVYYDVNLNNEIIKYFNGIKNRNYAICIEEKRTSSKYSTVEHCGIPSDLSIRHVRVIALELKDACAFCNKQTHTSANSDEMIDNIGTLAGMLQKMSNDWSIEHINWRGDFKMWLQTLKDADYLFNDFMEWWISLPSDVQKITKLLLTNRIKNIKIARSLEDKMESIESKRILLSHYGILFKHPERGWHVPALIEYWWSKKEKELPSVIEPTPVFSCHPKKEPTIIPPPSREPIRNVRVIMIIFMYLLLGIILLFIAMSSYWTALFVLVCGLVGFFVFAYLKKGFLRKPENLKHPEVSTDPLTNESVLLKLTLKPIPDTPDQAEITWKMDLCGTQDTRVTHFTNPFPGENLNLVIRTLNGLQSNEGSFSSEEVARLMILGIPHFDSGIPKDKGKIHQIVGEKLYNALIDSPEGRKIFTEAHNFATSNEYPLRLSLHMPKNAVALVAMPWELLWVPGEKTPLLLSHSKVYLTRHFDWLPRQSPPRLGTRPLKVRYIAPRYDNDTWEREHADHEKVWKRLGGNNNIELRPHLDSVTRKTICETLRNDKEIDVLHYYGKGNFNGGEGCLLLNEIDNKHEFVPISALAPIIGQTQTRLVVLVACKSAMVDAGDPSASVLQGMAQTLIAQGVPLVVAMQLNLRVSAAHQFTDVFYNELAEGHSVQEAVRAARMTIWTEESDRASWYVPTLYVGGRHNAEDVYLLKPAKSV